MEGERIKISNVKKIENRRFHINSTEFDMNFLSTENGYSSGVEREEILEHHNSCFAEMLEFVDKELKIQNRDLIGIKFTIPTIDNVLPFGMNYVERQELSTEMISDLLMMVQQSNSLFLDGDLLQISVTVIERKTGGARISLKRLCSGNRAELLHVKKRSILSIPSEDSFDDNKCLPRSIVLGQKWCDYNGDKAKYQKLFKNDNHLLKKLTDNLIRKVFGSMKNFEKHASGGVLADIVKFEKQLRSYQITVYDDVNFHRRAAYSSRRKKRKINIFFITNEKHFIALSNVRGFFGVAAKCELCDHLGNKKHRCGKLCSSCFQYPKCWTIYNEENQKKYPIKCTECLRYFRNKKCYENHKQLSLERGENGMKICEQIYICKFCFKYVNKETLAKNQIEKHDCEKRYCTVCRRETDHNHSCTIQKYTLQRPETFFIVFYDIESVQQKEIYMESRKKRGENEIWFEHEAILVCSQAVCEKCYRIIDKNFFCDQCGERERIFEGKNSLIDFMKYIFQYKPNKTKVVCIAHNSRSYDGQLVMNTVLTHFKNVDIDICSKGFKLMRIVFNNYIHFIDSLMFLQMPLAKFSETFELETTKGFSPFLFLSFENWNYEGVIPEPKYFSIDMNNKKRRAEFEEWYEEKKANTYNLRNETIEYCCNDVTLLRRGCVRFMQSVIAIADVNPFIQCFTLAQCALIIYRKQFMPENKLGIVPSNNYHMQTAQSKICRKWLTYLNYFQEKIEENTHFFIQPEVKLSDCGLIVDGYCPNYPIGEGSSNSKGTVFEFFGCYFHVRNVSKAIQ